MKIICKDSTCAFNSGSACNHGQASGRSDRFCEKYLEYTESTDYQSEYWKAYFDEKTKELFRRKAKGKKIERHGLIFYTEDDDRKFDHWLTEERTGIAIGTLNTIDQRIVEIKAGLPAYPDVLDVPERKE